MFLYEIFITYRNVVKIKEKNEDLYPFITLLLLFLPLILLFDVLSIVQVNGWKLSIFPLLYVFWNVLMALKTSESYKVKSNGEMLASFLDNNGLTSREKEIILLVIKGYGNKEISEMLFISLQTVKNHIYNIFKKIEVGNRCELITLVYEMKN